MNRPQFDNIDLNFRYTDISFLILFSPKKSAIWNQENRFFNNQMNFQKICTFGIFKINRIFQSCVFPFSQLFQWKIFHYLHFKWDSVLVYFYVVLLHSLQKYTSGDDDESLWWPATFWWQTNFWWRSPSDSSNCQINMIFNEYWNLFTEIEFRTYFGVFGVTTVGKHVTHSMVQ